MPTALNVIICGAEILNAYLRKHSAKVLLTLRRDQEGRTVLMLIKVFTAKGTGYLNHTLIVIPCLYLAFLNRKWLFSTLQFSEHFTLTTFLNVKTLQLK